MLKTIGFEKYIVLERNAYIFMIMGVYRYYGWPSIGLGYVNHIFKYFFKKTFPLCSYQESLQKIEQE